MKKNKEVEKNPSIAWGVASMMNGIVSIPLCVAPYFGLPLAILALIASYQQGKVKSNGFSLTGMILGIIGVVLNLGTMLLLFIGLIIFGV